MDNPFVIAAEILIILCALAVSLAVVAQRIVGKRGYSTHEINQATEEYKADRRALEQQAEAEAEPEGAVP